MQIDWFTFIAQIVNFLILLFLLRRFLFGPILRGMVQRQEVLAAEFAEAEAKARQAEEEAAQLHHQRQELDTQREALLKQAAAAAAERRRTMIGEARQEVEEMQSRWYGAIEDERSRFLHTLRMYLGEQVARLSRQALADLANVRVEEAMVEAVLEQLPDVGTSRLDQGSATTPILVRSAFPLAADLRTQLLDALSPDDGPPSAPEIEFATDRDLICGIEIVLPSRRLGWNIRDYLREVDGELEEALAAPHFRTPLPAPAEAKGTDILPG